VEVLDERTARAAWSLVIEPGDATAGAVIEALGARRALDWARRSVGRETAAAVRDLRAAVRESSSPGSRSSDVGPPRPSTVQAAVPEPGLGRCPPRSTGEPVGAGGGTAAGPGRSGPGRSGPGRSSRAEPDARTGSCAAPGAGAGEERAQGAEGAWSDGSDRPWWDRPGTHRVVARALARWEPRLPRADPRRALDALAEMDGALLVPGDQAWPVALADLGTLAPLCLWGRGTADLRSLTARSVAIVGARAATAYGEQVAGDLAAGLADAGATVVSGGAYGIDVAAHRGALVAGGATVALLAGGVDRPYPAGNRRVLDAIVTEGGALVAESPPGTPPVRSRFLLRNRLIAAVTGATVVVEAAWRSGALSTAARAVALLRPLGAVPGPVTSMASAGCHRLLRDGYAVCVTDAAEVLELLGVPGGPVGVGPTPVGGPDVGPSRWADVQDAAPSAGSDEGRVLDALRSRRWRSVDEIARTTGLGWSAVGAVLGVLELRGRATRGEGGRWRGAV
jgi:DNA processing protein